MLPNGHCASARRLDFGILANAPRKYFYQDCTVALIHFTKITRRCDEWDDVELCGSEKCVGRMRVRLILRDRQNAKF
jgi:hypothetical protein